MREAIPFPVAQKPKPDPVLAIIFAGMASSVEGDGSPRTVEMKGMLAAAHLSGMMQAAKMLEAQPGRPIILPAVLRKKIIAAAEGLGMQFNG